MNTLPWVGAFVACLWLTNYCFTTMEENGVGFAALVAALFCLVCLIAAVKEDWDILRGGNWK